MRRRPTAPSKSSPQPTTNPVTIPEYSVVRLEWTVFSVPPPTLTLTVSNSTQTVSWAGLTNVIYRAGRTNLTNFGQLADLGKSGTTPRPICGFGSFTNWNTGPQQFYRLLGNC
jgi:hypothetical protein